MTNISYRWTADSRSWECAFVAVPGTGDEPYAFGDHSQGIFVTVQDFFLALAPVTQALWSHVKGSNPSVNRRSDLPVENISWDELTQPGALGEAGAGTRFT